MSGPVETGPARSGAERRAGAGRRTQPGGPGRRADRPSGPAPARAPHGRGLVLRRPHGAGRRRRRGRHGHRSPPPHRPADRDLAGRGRGGPPRQPRRRAAHPSRPAQPHDRRTGRGPRRGGHRAQRRTPQARRSSSGWPSPRPPATATRPSSTTPTCRRSRSTRARPRCWWASSPGSTSPARADTDHVGVELSLRRGSTIVPLHPEHEHALVVLEGEVDLGAAAVGPGALAYLGSGRDELGLAMGDDARVILLGGTPFESEILMWWNFVARSPEEVEDARAAWQAHDEDRFPPVDALTEWIPAPSHVLRSAPPLRRCGRPSRLLRSAAQRRTLPGFADAIGPSRLLRSAAQRRECLRWLRSTRAAFSAAPRSAAQRRHAPPAPPMRWHHDEVTRPAVKLCETRSGSPPVPRSAWPTDAEEAP